jgi:hypothetical protein
MMAVWRLDSAAADLAMFSAAITTFALGVVASRTFEVLSTPLHFTILCLLCLAAGIALHHTVMAFAGTDRRKGQMVQLAMSMMILGWSALMVSQLANIVMLNQARVVIPPYDFLPGWWPTEIALVTVLQIVLVLAALLVALFSVGHIRFERSTFWTRVGQRLTPLLLVGYAAATIALVLQ